MASKTIVIDVINNTVGTPASNDGVMMLFVKGIAIGSTLALDTPYLLTKLADATALGITAAADVTNGTAVFQQVNEFYNGGLNDGALLWLVVTAIGTNPYATYVAGATFTNLVRHTAQADPTHRAKMIGFCYEVPTATQSASDFPSDVSNLITALQTAQQTLFAEGFQFSCIIDGYMMSTSVNPGTIGSLINKAASAVSICITGTTPNGVSSVGLALGRFARISLGHGFGAVADGPVNTPTGYLTNGCAIQPAGTLVVGVSYTVLGPAGASISYNSLTYNVGQTFTAVISHTTYTTTSNAYVITGCTPVVSLTSTLNNTTPGDVENLGNKQYMFLRTWFGQSGLFWNDAATCVDPALQISTQEFNRVANALSADALAFCILEMNKTQPLNPNTGNISDAALGSMEGEFFSQYIEPLINSGDISDGAIVFSGPNFNANKTLNFTLSINGEPITTSANGIVQYVSTLTQQSA